MAMAAKTTESVRFAEPTGVGVTSGPDGETGGTEDDGLAVAEGLLAGVAVGDGLGGAGEGLCLTGGVVATGEHWVGGGRLGVTVNAAPALTRPPFWSRCEAATLALGGLTVPGMSTQMLKVPSALTVTSPATWRRPTLIVTGVHGDGEAQNPRPSTRAVVPGGPELGVTVIDGLVSARATRTG
jgi:hypothetical protein